MARLSTVVNCFCDLGLDCHTKGRIQEEMGIEEGPTSALHHLLVAWGDFRRGGLLQRNARREVPA